MSGWTWAWLGWGAYFAVVEGMALYRSKPGDTLSEHIWAWFGTAAGTGRPANAWARIRRVVLLGFLAWLVTHFLTGGWV